MLPPAAPSCNPTVKLIAVNQPPAAFPQGPESATDDQAVNLRRAEGQVLSRIADAVKPLSGALLQCCQSSRHAVGDEI
jgi:hypothetical protein